MAKQDPENKFYHVLLCLQEESSDKVQVEGVNTELRSQGATLKKERMELSEQLQNKINGLGKISVRNVNKRVNRQKEINNEFKVKLGEKDAKVHDLEALNKS